MKCSNCKSIIKNESLTIHIGDGDFVCDKKCETQFIKNRENFFNNVSNDSWFNNWLENQ